jgi:Tol biopolymer transport system component
MKGKIRLKNIIRIISCFLVTATTVFGQESKLQELTGPYLGQIPPDTTPVVFAPGIVSLPGFTEYSGTFSSDGNEYYFYRFNDTTTAKIYCSKMIGEDWTDPEPVGFSSGYAAYEPHLTLDNQSLYFAWNTGGPLPGIYVTHREADTWAPPTYAGQGMFVSSDATGQIYLTDLSVLMTTGKTYLAKVSVVDDRFVNYQRLNINPNYGSQAHPFIAPDGSYILFDVNGGKYMYISFKKQDGTWGTAIDLTKHGFDANAGGATVSPDGKYLFFFLNKDIWWVSTQFIERLRPAKGRLAYAITPSDGNSEIFLVYPDGSGKTQLTNETGKPYGPAYSPDGTKIAFYNHVSDQTWSLYMMDADGGNVWRITNASDTLDWSPDWSPDGKKLVFARSVSSPIWRSEIWMMNANGSDLHKLSDANGQGPDWSPDGSKIAYFNFVDGGGDIWTMNADGTNPVQLTTNSSEDWCPKFSPDGSKIAFQSKRDGNHEIYVMNSDGSNPIRLTNNSANDEDPNWSPDGKTIAFVSMRDGHYEIYTMNAEGSNQMRVTTTSGNAIDPDWKPLPQAPPLSDSVLINFKTGWNMISVPTDSIYLKNDIFPFSISSAYFYDSGSADYVMNDTLQKGRAYWVQFPSSGITTLYEDAIYVDSIDVKTGWNMIGSISILVPVTSMLSEPTGITTSCFFRYQSGYRTTDTIVPGIGYWVKVDQPGRLILSASEDIRAKNRICIMQSEEMPPPPPVSENMSENNEAVPTQCELIQNYPNPFNPVTTMSYTIPIKSDVQLEIYNVLGSLVKTLVDEIQDPGRYSLVWDGTDNSGTPVSSGMYFYRLTNGNYSRAQKALLIR